VEFPKANAGNLLQWSNFEVPSAERIFQTHVSVLQGSIPVANILKAFCFIVSDKPMTNPFSQKCRIL
jgi:hypothetical protein